MPKPQNLEQCELCGRSSNLINTIIEGSMLSVCKNCVGFGEAVVLDKPRETAKKPRKIHLVEEKSFLTKTYPSLIKQSREKLNLKQKELAQKLGEKESIIHQLESGLLEPSEKLAKKLESFLKINLMETSEENKTDVNFSDSSLTIGDLLKKHE